MRYVEAKGTPREIGRQQGAVLRELIQQRWEEDVGRVRAKANAEAEIERIHRDCRKFLTQLAPDIVEEIEGLGEGAGLSSDQALWFSTYNSITMSLGNSAFDTNGCSALAFTQSPVGPFVFKTYDPFGAKDIDRRAKGELENRWLYVLRAEYAGGCSMIGVRMAGSIWTECAVNNHGLAFAAASLHPRLYPQQARALPQHFLGTLGINRCRTTAEIRELMARVPVFGKGYATAWADLSGDCVGVEKTADCTGFNAPQSGVAFQTNHVRSSELERRGREQDPAFWSGKYHQNSSNRVRRIAERLPRWSAELQFDVIINDLFHAGSLGDLIQDCTEQNQYWITTWGALVFPRTQELWIAEGLPEEKQFQKWKL